MSYTVLTDVMASLASQSVPRVLAHVKVLRALLEWAKERGGDALEKKCWTPACMAHASKIPAYAYAARAMVVLAASTWICGRAMWPRGRL